MISANEARKIAGIKRYDSMWLIKELDKHITQTAKKGETEMVYLLDACSKGLTRDELTLVWSVLDQEGYMTRIEDAGPGIYKVFIRW